MVTMKTVFAKRPFPLKRKQFECDLRWATCYPAVTPHRRPINSIKQPVSQSGRVESVIEADPVSPSLFCLTGFCPVRLCGTIKRCQENSKKDVHGPTEAEHQRQQQHWPLKITAALSGKFLHRLVKTLTLAAARYDPPVRMNLQHPVLQRC